MYSGFGFFLTHGFIIDLYNDCKSKKKKNLKINNKK